MELSMDTSTRHASVALSRDGEVTMQLAWRSEQNHSVEFVPAARRLMEQAGVEVGQLRAVFVAKGPGGFSALRVGVSVAKSLAMAQEIPLVAVGTLDIEAQPYLGLGVPVCAVLPAGRTTVYTGMYGAGEAEGGPHDVGTIDDAISGVTEKTLFCGEAVVGVAGLLQETLGDMALVVDVPPPTRRPSVLAQLGYRRLQASDTDDPDTLQPVYMRGAQFETAQRETTRRRARSKGAVS